MVSNWSAVKTAEMNKNWTKYCYKPYVQALNDRDGLTLDEFKETRWANYFSVDLSTTYKNGKANANHVFEHFGALNNSSPSKVRNDLLQDVATDFDFYQKCSTVCLAMRSMSIDTWVDYIGSDRNYCDELGLKGLCKLYQKHSVVLTKTRIWSTIDADALFNLLELLQECSIRLIYLGHLRFGTLV